MSSADALITPADGLALELGVVKAHLRVDHDTEDALIEALIGAATEWVETFTNRVLLTQTWDRLLDEVEGECIALPKSPVASVTHVKYIDTAGTLTTWSSSLYQVDVASIRGRIAPAWGQCWPCAREQFGAWQIRYVCGYGTPDDIPMAIRQAMLLIIGHWFEHRESVADFQVFGVPLSSEHLLWRFRVPSL